MHDETMDSFYEELQHVLIQYLRTTWKNSLEDFKAKVGREDIFNPTIWNGSLHNISNDNGVRVANFAT